jgi:hypothetical protein
MSASKKNITKSATSPAPASKTAAKPAALKKTAAAKPAALKKTAAPTVRASTPVATAAPKVATAAPSPAPVAKPAVAPAAAKPVKTIINARVDVGFGNTLVVRGEGPGLSWETGVAMTNVGADAWQLTLPESGRPYIFKFLVNDTRWSAGTDFTAVSGTSVTLTPEF